MLLIQSVTMIMVDIQSWFMGLTAGVPLWFWLIRQAERRHIQAVIRAESMTAAVRDHCTVLLQLTAGSSAVPVLPDSLVWAESRVLLAQERGNVVGRVLGRVMLVITLLGVYTCIHRALDQSEWLWWLAVAFYGALAVAMVWSNRHWKHWLSNNEQLVPAVLPEEDGSYTVSVPIVPTNIPSP